MLLNKERHGLHSTYVFALIYAIVFYLKKLPASLSLICIFTSS